MISKLPDFNYRYSKIDDYRSKIVSTLNERVKLVSDVTATYPSIITLEESSKPSGYYLKFGDREYYWEAKIMPISDKMLFKVYNMDTKRHNVITEQVEKLSFLTYYDDDADDYRTVFDGEDLRFIKPIDVVNAFLKRFLDFQKKIEEEECQKSSATFEGK